MKSIGNSKTVLNLGLVIFGGLLGSVDRASGLPQHSVDPARNADDDYFGRCMFAVLFFICIGLWCLVVCVKPESSQLQDSDKNFEKRRLFSA